MRNRGIELALVPMQLGLPPTYSPRPSPLPSYAVPGIILCHLRYHPMPIAHALAPTRLGPTPLRLLLAMPSPLSPMPPSFSPPMDLCRLRYYPTPCYLSSYAPAMRCAVLRQAMLVPGPRDLQWLLAGEGIPGTDV
eukprot:299750-Rhodomonas_salina.5